MAGRRDLGETASNTIDAVKHAVGGAVPPMPSMRDVRRGASRLGTIIRENPIAATAGALAIGFAIGALLPRTRAESSRIEDVRQLARDTAVQAVEDGMQILRDTLRAMLGSLRSE